MRTKALLGLAALVASAFVASAQTPVYSLNVVGYVNKSFTKDLFTLVSNPLKATNTNLKAIIPNPPDNTQVWRWLVGAQDLDVANIATYSATQQKWIPEPNINAGEGFFVVAGENFTNTFVGEVLQGSLTNSLVGNQNFEAIGSMVPVGGSLTNVLAQYPAVDNDQVWVWLTGAQDLDVANIATWSATQQKWVPDANIPVGDGFFLVRAGGPVNYVRNFTVQ